MPLDWHPEALLSELEVKYEDTLSRVSDMVKDDAKSTCPVKTGALKASIRKEIDMAERASYVGSDLDYSVYVELGTQNRPANPFLRRALDKAQQFLGMVWG
jgi:HK97 gp10 family phage protein